VKIQRLDEKTLNNFFPLLIKSKKEVILLHPNEKKLKYFLLYLVKAKKEEKSNL